MGNFFWVELIVSVLNIHVISVRLLGGKFNVKKAALAACVVLSWIFCTFLFLGSPLGRVFFMCATLTGCVMPLITLSGIGKVKVIYITLLYTGVSGTLAISGMWIIQIFTMDTLLWEGLNIVIQCALLAACVIFSVNSVFYKAKRYIDLIPMKLKVLLLFSVWLSNGFAISLSSYALQYPRTFALTFAECSAAAIIILVGVMWPLIIIGNSLNASYKTALDNLDAQIQAQVRQYEFVIQANEDIRRFRHDFENLKLGLTGHLQNGDTEGALRFLGECGQSIRDEYIAFKTGNPVADALLSEKQATAKANGARIDFDGIIPCAGLSTTDICVILGNILDNAIEACAGLPGEKVISVSAYMNNGFVFLTILNPVKENVPLGAGIPDTSKKDRKNHGIGLASAYNSVRKYNGVMKLACADRVFSTEITLDLNGVY